MAFEPRSPQNSIELKRDVRQAEIGAQEHLSPSSVAWMILEVRRALPAVASAATTTATATATAVSATTTATATVLARFGLIDGQFAALEIVAVQGFDGSAGAFVFHCDKAESAGPAGITIRDHRYFLDLAVVGEQRLQRGFGRVEGHVAYVKLHNKGSGKQVTGSWQSIRSEVGKDMGFGHGALCTQTTVA